MHVTLSDGQVIDVLAVDIARGKVDWKRTTGYNGVCVSPVDLVTLENAMVDAGVAITAVLETEIVRVKKELETDIAPVTGG